MIDTIDVLSLEKGLKEALPLVTGTVKLPGLDGVT